MLSRLPAVATYYRQLQVDVGVPYLRQGQWAVSVTDTMNRTKVRFVRLEGAGGSASPSEDDRPAYDRLRAGRRITLCRIATDAIRAAAGGGQPVSA